MSNILKAFINIIDNYQVNIKILLMEIIEQIIWVWD